MAIAALAIRAELFSGSDRKRARARLNREAMDTLDYQHVP
jgi:hypothetical protein